MGTNLRMNVHMSYLSVCAHISVHRWERKKMLNTPIHDGQILVELWPKTHNKLLGKAVPYRQQPAQEPSLPEVKPEEVRWLSLVTMQEAKQKTCVTTELYWPALISNCQLRFWSHLQHRTNYRMAACQPNQPNSTPVFLPRSAASLDSTPGATFWNYTFHSLSLYEKQVTVAGCLTTASSG